MEPFNATIKKNVELSQLSWISKSVKINFKYLSPLIFKFRYSFLDISTKIRQKYEMQYFLIYEIILI